MSFAVCPLGSWGCPHCHLTHRGHKGSSQVPLGLDKVSPQQPSPLALQNPEYS